MADWQRARLIPTSGIDSVREAESRATSALLAVLSVVRPYSKALLDRLGASRALNATVDTFIEVGFDWNGKRIRPDGVVRVAQGKRPPWAAIIEVKTGENRLDADQVNLYWDVARANGYDAVITISNEIAPRLGEHPTAGLKVRANSPVQVHHYSWTYLLAEALVQKRHRGIEDPEQSWILGELIRYLEHPASGATKFDDMGQSWVEVRDGARNGSLARRGTGVTEVATRWVRLLRYAGLRLGAAIGEDVRPVWTLRRDADGNRRIGQLAATLAESGQLDGALRVPNTAGDLQITADIRARQLLVCVDVDAPQDRGARTRVRWLLDQLPEAPPGLVIEAWQKQARTPVAAVTLGAAREDRALLSPRGAGATRFRLLLRGELGVARRSGGRSPGFIDSVVRSIEDFYVTVIQNLKPWRPPAPRKEVETDRSTVSVEEAIPAEVLAELGAGESANHNGVANGRDAASPVEALGEQVPTG
jgi:hypothetical protein